MITLHTLAYSELYRDVFVTVSQFLSMQSFMGFFRVVALMGMVVAVMRFSASRSPLVFAKWWITYVLCAQLILLLKTTVSIEELNGKAPIIVENVPVLVALTTSITTTLGVGLAQSYDAIFTDPSHFVFTKNGLLPESRMLHDLQNLTIHNPVLQEALDHYLRSCVVGDIRINQKYQWGDLERATHLYAFLEQHASPLRMIAFSSQLMTCKEALRLNAHPGLREALIAEVKAYEEKGGGHLFSGGIGYEGGFRFLFETYFGVKDSKEAIVMQLLLMHALQDGAKHYKAYADSVTFHANGEKTMISNLAEMSQYLVNGLPLLHALFLLLWIGLFPLVIACTMIPGCERMRKTYLQIFASIHCWPLLCAILNDCLRRYGVHYGATDAGLCLSSLNSIIKTHDCLLIAGGCMSLMIPFLAYQLVFAFARKG